MLQDCARIVVGFHGTHSDCAAEIVRTGQFVPSDNDYDWLGHGVYFWEYAPRRAWQWAREKFGAGAAVISAEIELRRCLDLTDIGYTESLRVAYQRLREAYASKGKALPVNKHKARCLDCLVINYLCGDILPECDTVRAPFLEGNQIYDGSALLTQSHLQLVVRNRDCIKRPVQTTPKEA